MEDLKMMEDKFLKEILAESAMDKAPADFTISVMDRINSDGFAKVVNQPILSAKYWILIGLGLATAIFVLFGLDWSFLNPAFDTLSPENFSAPSWSVNLFGGIQSIFSGVEFSPIFAIAIAAVLSLFVLERIVRKTFTVNLFVI